MRIYFPWGEFCRRNGFAQFAEVNFSCWKWRREPRITVRPKPKLLSHYSFLFMNYKLENVLFVNVKTLAIFNHHIVLLCDVLWRYKYMKEDMSSSSMIWIVEWKLKGIPVVVHVCSDRYWLRADLLHKIVMRIRTACCWFYMLPLVLTGTDVHLASLCFMFDCLFQNPWDLMLSFRMIFFFAVAGL